MTKKIKISSAKKEKRDMLEALTCFSTPIYSIKKPNFLVSNREVVDDYLSKVRNPIGGLHIHPYQSENIYNDSRMLEFSTYIAETTWNILASQGFNMDPFATNMIEMWAQEYHNTSQMPQHIHGSGSQIIGFYFLKCPTNWSKILIHDARPGKVQINLPETDINQLTHASLMCNFTPEEGMLLFTNSWVPHSFTPHTSDEPLTFIHFNVGIIDKNLVAQSIVPTSTASAPTIV